MTDVYLKRAPMLAPGLIAQAIHLRAEETHTLLAQMDAQGLYFYDRRGGKHHLLTWEQLEQLCQHVLHTRGGAA